MMIRQFIKLNLTPVFYVSIAILALSCACFSQAPNLKGKYSKKIMEPKSAHITNELIARKLKRIRGKLLIGENEIPINSIISVYKIANNKSEFLFSYLVGADGKFDFKRLKEGTYYLKTGTTDGYFNQNNVKIILAPRDKDSSSEDLEIPMQVGT